MLSTQIGSGATTSGGASGASGNSASGGGTSGQTTSGGTSSGTTSGVTPGNCVIEREDSGEKNPLTITSCAKGSFNFPRDQEDWLEFERPKNSNFSANWTGPLNVTFWDDRGRNYTIKNLPNNPGTYLIQIQYDFVNYPLSGDQLKQAPSFDWTFNILF